MVGSSSASQSGSLPWYSPWDSSNAISQISLPVTFGTRENFQTENIHPEVADFEIAYNAFLGRSALNKFMAIPHYAYLELKMPVPCGVISIRGDVKWAYDCAKESCKMVDRLTASTELQELKESFIESPPDPVMPDSNASKMSI
jgi:hypothetical protein